ncbi:hypothetical protein [Motilimonas pumila]|uniref:Uncharacterized protein n=1 Tax=Motilimonas pumila TaxID=2303987 RepID=A0A418YA40_9GAMM|nr:hypothetical protein [Motilimonas pumila]RJG38982.1 hypothetical protein D1Z90_18590 [Motilimonas pumila]
MKTQLSHLHCEKVSHDRNVDIQASPLMILLSLPFKDKVRGNHAMIVERELDALCNSMRHLKARYDISFKENLTPRYRLAIQKTPKGLYLRWRATGRGGRYTSYEKAIRQPGVSTEAIPLMKTAEPIRSALNEKAQLLMCALNILQGKSKIV